MHHTPEGRYYFDRQENLTKLLQELAHDAPQPLIDDLIDHRLREMFEPSRKTAYDDVLPLPRLEDVADRVPGTAHPAHRQPGLEDAARGGADASSTASARRTTCAC